MKNHKKRREPDNAKRPCEELHLLSKWFSFGSFQNRDLLALTRSLCVLSLQSQHFYLKDIYKFFGSKVLQLIIIKNKFPLELFFLNNVKIKIKLIFSLKILIKCYRKKQINFNIETIIYFSFFSTQEF